MVGSGLVLWKPKGAVIRNELQDYLRSELVKGGYQPVYTPHVGKLGLYRTSGHFPYNKESQFPALYESRKQALLNELWQLVRERPEGEPASVKEQDIARQLLELDPELDKQFITCSTEKGGDLLSPLDD